MIRGYGAAALEWRERNALAVMAIVTKIVTVIVMETSTMTSIVTAATDATEATVITSTPAMEDTTTGAECNS